MTVTEKEGGEIKRASSPDLSYVPLQGSNADGEGRASSEESQQGNNHSNRPTGAELGALIPPSSRTGHAVVLASNGISNSSNHVPEELAPLNKLDVAAKDSQSADVGAFIIPTSEFEPPDGGVRAWSIMIASFLINGILFGTMNSYSIIYTELFNLLEASGKTDASSKAALVGSLTIGTTFLLSPVAGILTDKFGIRITTFAGGALASSGMLLSCIFYNKVETLCLTYGIMYGLGASLAYTPSLVILGHYFKRNIGLVNGVVTAGSSIFTMLVPFVMEPLIKAVKLQGLFGFQAALTASVMGCALLFKPILPPPVAKTGPTHHRSNLKMKLSEVVNISIWKKKRYVIWAVSIPIALFGYFVPYVHIGKFVELQFKGEDKKWPVMCIGLTSGLGRLLFGYIADKPRVNRVLLQQFSFFTIGVLTMLLPLTSSFNVLLLITLGMGLVDGCFISLLGPIAFDVCGQKDATQAIGFLLGMCALPLTSGPPIAGLLYDNTNSYDLAFYLAGIPPIVGALAMFMVFRVKDERTSLVENGTESSNRPDRPLAQSAWQNGNGIRSGKGRTRDEARRAGGDYICRGVNQRTEVGTRRTSSYRYEYFDLLYHNYQGEKMYEAVTCGNPACPHHGCSGDTRRFSESVPLLLGIKCLSCDDSKDVGRPHSFLVNFPNHAKKRPQPDNDVRFSDR